MHKERKCDYPKCNELATRRVWTRRTLGTLPVPKLMNFCEGHAFIHLGSIEYMDVSICPVCLTHFPLECLDGQKKIQSR